MLITLLMPLNPAIYTAKLLICPVFIGIITTFTEFYAAFHAKPLRFYFYKINLYSIQTFYTNPF